MLINYKGERVTVQTFHGPMTIIEKCIYKPEWSAWEKLYNVEPGANTVVSDTFWNLYAYDTEAQARAANPEFADTTVFEVGCPF